MSGFWQVTGNSSGGTAARMTITPPPGSGGMVRILAMQATTEVAAVLRIQDGTTAIWQLDAPAGFSGLQIAGIDIRALTTGSLTIDFDSNAVKGSQFINAQGDFVPPGYPTPVSYRGDISP